MVLKALTTQLIWTGKDYTSLKLTQIIFSVIYGSILKLSFDSIIQMFQPNSIKSLLRRKEQKSLEGNDQLDKSSPGGSKTTLYDPDVEILIENKSTIKQIDMTIQNIREWRLQQSQNLKNALKMNEELANALAAQPSNSPDYQAELDKHTATIKEQQERLKQLQQEIEKEDAMKSESEVFSSYFKEKQQDWDRKKESLMNSKETPLKDHQQAFIQSVVTMGQIFKKKDLTNQGGDQAPKKPIATAQIKGQLAQIDKQLKELEDLLKDVEG